MANKIKYMQSQGLYHDPENSKKVPGLEETLSKVWKILSIMCISIFFLIPSLAKGHIKISEITTDVFDCSRV